MNLRAADQAAQQRSAGMDVDAVTAPCAASDRRQRIVVQVRGDDDQGVGDVAVVLMNGAGKAMSRRTAPDGCCEFEGLEAGGHTLRLPELDRDSWMQADVETLQGDAATSRAGAAWAEPPPGAGTGDIVHVVAQGECIAKIAERFGFFPETIWNHSANEALRATRDSMYILAPADRVVVPARRIKDIPVQAGTRLVLRRKGVPERLRIRFLTSAKAPRAGVAFALSITTPGDMPVADVAGRTDADGFVDAFIPPAAVMADLVLIDDGARETYQFRLGHVDPLDTMSGWQARLNNLGYPCDGDGGQAGEHTRQAILSFQRDQQLPATGDMDEATLRMLESMALS